MGCWCRQHDGTSQITVSNINSLQLASFPIVLILDKINMPPLLIFMMPSQDVFTVIVKSLKLMSICSLWQNKLVKNTFFKVCHAVFDNFPLEFRVSRNGLKSKNISGRSSYTRHLNYYVSKEMTACVREADKSPCSYVLFMLEL